MHGPDMAVEPARLEWIQGGVGSEIHDLFGPDQLPGHITAAAEPVDQTEFQALLSGPEQAAEDLIVRPGETLATALADYLDELSMNLVEKALDVQYLG